MAGSSNRRVAFTLQICAASAVAFSSSALAETKTLVCEEQLGQSWTFNVDFSENTISYLSMKEAAKIGTQQIEFKFRREPKQHPDDGGPGTVVGSIVEGTISRLTGALEGTYSQLVYGKRYPEYSRPIRARCREATTTKF